MMGPMKQLHSSKSHMKLREEKARTLFAKYGMTLEPGEWTTPVTGTTQWVEKKVVMRVHRQCHRCQTTFGADKLCSNCTHTRCKKCPRFPTKKPKEHKKDTGFTIAIDSNDMAKDLLASLSMPSRFERENVRRQPVQRVRRTCHKCFTLFKGKANQCEDCKHQRCPQCPREPYVFPLISLLHRTQPASTNHCRSPKLKKHPNGYPGDVEETFPLAQRTLRSPRTRFRWECHTCYQPFIEHEKVCRGCQHERCNQCPRKPPKKVRAQPDPEVVRSVEEKMAKMGLNAPAPAAAA